MKVQSIYTNRFVKKGLKFAADNGSLFVASASLALSTVARPLSIMATPNTDKQKICLCKIPSIQCCRIYGYAGKFNTVSKSNKKY